MDKPALLCTAYLPSVNYMAVVKQAEEIRIEIHETYPKQTCRNHCHIFGPNGRQKLTIPVDKPNGNKTKTFEVRISGHEPWQRSHWRSIETAYNNSPYFLYYQDFFRPFYEKKFDFLVDFNLEIIQMVSLILKIPSKISQTTSFEKIPLKWLDFRDDPGIVKMGYLPDNPRYMQVFEPAHGFMPGLSITDALFNLGPETSAYLDQVAHSL